MSVSENQEPGYVIGQSTDQARASRWKMILGALAVVALAGGALAFEIITTRPVRGALQTCAELFTIANREDLDDAERLAAAQSLCTARYVRAHPIALAAEGGLVGFPRNINKNFKAWREGPDVWICPTNRVGAVYQFVWENGRWRFDGPIAVLRPMGELVPISDLPGPLPD